jgi:CRISPR-associated protein Cmr5
MSLKSQRLAQEAYARIAARRDAPEGESYRKEYRSFARDFPTLVHQCGLVQAVAFAQARREHRSDYLSDLAAMLSVVGHGSGNSAALAEDTRRLGVSAYVRLSRDALDAAVWLKRYVEALFEPTPQTVSTPEDS